MTILLSKKNICAWFLAFVALFFAISPLPGGSAYRYLFFVATPACVTILFLNRRNRYFINECFSSAAQFIKPILPFFFTLIFVWLIHWKPSVRHGIGGEAMMIVGIFMLNGLFFAVLKTKKIEIPSTALLISCALSICLAVVYFCFISHSHEVSIFQIRPFVKPYVTIFAKSLGLISGITLLGAFIFPNLSLPLRAFFLGISLLGLVGTIGFLSVRGTLFIPFIALCCLAFYHGARKLKILIFATVSLMALSASLVCFTPIGDRILLGVQEVQTVVSSPLLDNVFEKISSNQTLSPEEEKIKLAANNSMGARIAVWKLALQQTHGHELIGLGVNRPNDLLDVSSLFSYSKDYLPHFHSDFIQVYVLGGFVLLLGLIVSIVLLLYQSRDNCLKVFLIMALISYGVVDLGFLELRTMTVFSGAWAILSLPSYEDFCRFNS